VNSAATVTVQTLTGIYRTIGTALPRRIRPYAEPRPVDFAVPGIRYGAGAQT
jgi:hypothetical protein